MNKQEFEEFKTLYKTLRQSREGEETESIRERLDELWYGMTPDQQASCRKWIGEYLLNKK